MSYDKDEARKIIHARLDTLKDDEYAALATKVYENVVIWLTEALVDRGIKTILLYHAMQKWREVDLSSLEKRFGDIQFDYVSFEANAPFPTKNYDIITVPLYGFTDDGYRLGHGNGWYDKYLAANPSVLRLGVGFEICLVGFLVSAYDIPMDIFVTDSRICTTPCLTRPHSESVTGFGE